MANAHTPEGAATIIERTVEDVMKQYVIPSLEQRVRDALTELRDNIQDIVTEQVTRELKKGVRVSVTIGDGS